MALSLTTSRIAAIAATTAVLAVAITACGSTDAPSDQLVLAEGQPLGDYNPLLGYGALGVSPIYEGLLAPKADTDQQIPDLVPSLASDTPSRLSATTWRVPLRQGVTFSDGTTLDAADVVATYKAVADPAVASDIAGQFTPIRDVAADGTHAVTVTMDSPVDPHPYLLLGIVPSELVEDRPAAEWGINHRPVGTGPYRLESLRPDQAVLTARDDYRDDQPAVRRVVYVHTPDDNVRAQRMKAGEIDGANLPPRLAESATAKGNATVASVQTADWRAVSLPAGNAFTADRAARLSMNLLADRPKMITDVLAGQGQPASTPIGPVYGDYYSGEAFTRDSGQAAKTLDAAGWLRGPDGMREREGVRAEFTLRYDSQDTVRRDLAVAFAEQLRPAGIEVHTVGSSWDDIEAYLGTDAVLLAGGEMPYAIDQQTVTTLHTRTPGASPFSNPGNFTAPGRDALLDQARATPDGPEKIGLYRQIQQSYLADPSSVFLAFVNHTYAVRDTAMAAPAPILEPHSHGVTWGPWWNLTGWKATS